MFSNAWLTISFIAASCESGSDASCLAARLTSLADGSVSYRGAVYYETQSEKWKRLNTVALVFEYEVDGEGNTRTKFWEWK
jgi:hypothetical protein